MKKLQSPGFIVKVFFVMIVFIYKVDFVSGQEENLYLFDKWIQWSDGKNMLVKHLNKQAFTILDKRDKEIAELKTKDAWVKRKEKVKEIFKTTLGSFPEKTELKSQVTAVLEMDGYRIEKIIYESMPRFYVTGCLFIPNEIKGKRPAILFVSGHAQESFRVVSYQTMILNLVKKGLIVFAIDPISQGERVQLYDNEKNASAVGPTTEEHNYLGHQTFISGISLARYFVWDGIRAVDYLLTRKEVDAGNIGVTGQSGGGTQAAYIFAFDERVKAAAPVDYITGYRRLIESIGPQDAEQNLYHGILNGLTHADLLEVRVPNPALISAGTRDFFSIQGARETYKEVQHAYKAFGREDHISMQEDDFGHGYTHKLREGINGFFQKHLNLPGVSKDENIKIIDPKDLRVSKTGFIATSFQNTESVFSINKRATQEMLNKIQISRKNTEAHLKKVNTDAKELSGFIAPPQSVKSVYRGRYQRKDYFVEMHALQGEGDYMIPLLLFIPNKGIKFSGIIYLNPQGKFVDALVGGKIEQLVRMGYLVAAPDVIGTGETAPDGYNYIPNFTSILIGRSIIGLQAGDVIRVANFLENRNDVDKMRIGGLAFDEMCPTLLHAAMFSKSISNVALAGSLISYKTIAMNKYYDSDFCINYIGGVLTGYDLPDVIASIAPRKIALVDLKDQTKSKASASLTNDELLFPRSVYSIKNARNSLNVFPSSTDIQSVVSWCFQ